MRTAPAALLLLLLLPATGWAHELRPAYLQLTEIASGEYAVLFKVPMLADRRLALTPDFGAGAAATSPIRTRQLGGACVQEWTLRAPELPGAILSIEGLRATMTDALVRAEQLDGSSWTLRLTADQPSGAVPARQGAAAVGFVYAGLGVEHVLGGIDHLLFVLALLLLTKGRWLLVKTITAFTAAHSVTLALAALGFVHVPQEPVEACIALSIVLVAAEAVRRRKEASFAARAPWAVAFAFGLLHGLGFAGALSEIGLPEGRVPLALLAFNAGIEAGQLAFVGAVLAAAGLIHRFVVVRGRWARFVPAYGIGGIATHWFLQRLMAF